MPDEDASVQKAVVIGARFPVISGIQLARQAPVEMAHVYQHTGGDEIADFGKVTVGKPGFITWYAYRFKNSVGTAYGQLEAGTPWIPYAIFNQEVFVR